jgi:cholesterol oxidase
VKDVYDIVVIGSGFGGSISACRLAQAGRSVCVLERGKRWNKQDFPRTLGQMTHAFWNDKDFGLLDYRVFHNIDVIQASGVGGGSLVYFNVHKRAKKEIFEQPQWPRGVRRETLDPFYDRAKAMLEAQPLSPPAGLPLPTRTRTMIAAGRETGGLPELVDICVYTGPERVNPYSGIAQSPCVYCGNCMLGCHVHAKNTLDLNYLPLAEKSGAEVYSLHEVQGIEPLSSPKDSYKVAFRRFGFPSDVNAESGSVIGRSVIIAAGTLGSTELLLKCRDAHRTLPNLSARLGARFSGNGDALIPLTIDTPQEIDDAWGPSITAGMDCSTDAHQIYLEDLGVPDPFFWYAQGLPTPSKVRNVWRVLKEYLFAAIGSREEALPAIEFRRLFEGGLVRSMLYLGMGTDDADGQMSLRNGRIDIVWSKTSSRKMFDEMEQALKRISEAMNGKYRSSPLWDWPLRKLLTAHPLGGCAMSESKAGGVVNEFGEVWDYPNLHVIDGSIIPTALAINPSATISALAERAAARLASK